MMYHQVPSCGWGSELIAARRDRAHDLLAVNLALGFVQGASGAKIDAMGLLEHRSEALGWDSLHWFSTLKL